MDNTELHYLTYDPEEIWDTMLVNYVEAGGDILYPGDEKEMLLRSVQEDIVQVFAGVDNALRMMTLRYAVRDYLDVYGESKGCERIAASAATAVVTITAKETGEAGVLEAGTAMTCDGELFYLLVNDLTLTGYRQEADAEVIADRAGNVGNGLLAGTQMDLASPNPAIEKIVVKEGAKGGNNQEKDEAYRERIRNSGFSSLTTGPSQQYEAVTESVSSEILDAKALKAAAGEVGVYIILASDEGKDAIIKSVEEALSAEDVRPLTDKVTVHEAEAVPYKLTVQYASDNSEAVATAISEAVKAYQEWQDNKIGRPFNPDQLMAWIYQAGADRVVWGEDSNFNESGPVKYTEIEENQRCKGTISTSSMQAKG